MCHQWQKLRNEHKRQARWHIRPSGREQGTWKALAVSPRTSHWAHRRKSVPGHRPQSGYQGVNQEARASFSQEVLPAAPHPSSWAQRSDVRRNLEMPSGPDAAGRSPSPHERGERRFGEGGAGLQLGCKSEVSLQLSVP